MKLYNLPCLLEEDKCKFQTVPLEFAQSKEILEMHMVLVHGRPEFKCDNCDRDTHCDTNIIEDHKEINGAKFDDIYHNLNYQNAQKLKETNESNYLTVLQTIG